MTVDPKRLRRRLDRLYATHNQPEFLRPDPLQVVLDAPKTPDPADREVIALIAAGLAYGRVASILNGIDIVLSALGDRPATALRDGPLDRIKYELRDFQYRWTHAHHLYELFDGLHRVLNEDGTLQAAFLRHFRPNHPDIIKGLGGLMFDLSPDPARNSLLAVPDGGSACKRLHMFMRWMVRNDAIDPGLWPGIPASKLLVPVDTHMHQIALRLGFTTRKQATFATVMDITGAFRQIRPRDPVRYDFSLTRLGIRADSDPEEWLRSL